jgi:hypothetical protein
LMNKKSLWDCILLRILLSRQRLGVTVKSSFKRQ